MKKQNNNKKHFLHLMVIFFALLVINLAFYSLYNRAEYKARTPMIAIPMEEGVSVYVGDKKFTYTGGDNYSVETVSGVEEGFILIK